MARIYRERLRSNTNLDYDFQTGYVSDPINHHIPLPATRHIVRQSGFERARSTLASNFAVVDILNSNAQGELYPKLYDRFYDKARGGKGAALALTLLEWRSSVSMIATRAAMITRSVRALDRGDLYGAIRHLNVNPEKSAKRVSRRAIRKNLANTWLELNFGWAPLISDIHQAVDVMQQQIPSVPIRVRGSEPRSFTYIDDTNPHGFWLKNAEGTLQLQLSGQIDSVNPNLLLANQLGLLNPAFILWDKVPFSFVIDWFLPVGNFLKSFDKTIGIDLQYSCISTTAKARGYERYVYNNYDGVRDETTTCGSVLFKRELKPFPFPSFASRVTVPQLNLWQAATSVALLSTSLARFVPKVRLPRDYTE